MCQMNVRDRPHLLWAFFQDGLIPLALIDTPNDRAAFEAHAQTWLDRAATLRAIAVKNNCAHDPTSGPLKSALLYEQNALEVLMICP